MGLLTELSRAWSYRAGPPGLGTWIDAVSKWLDAGSIYPDIDTLVPGNVALPNWTTIAGANAPDTLANAASYSVDGLASATWVNPGGFTPGTGQLACAKGPPVGVSSVNVKIRASLPIGVVSSTLYLELRTTAGVLIASGTVALSANMTTYTPISLAPVAWPTEYIVSCFFNQAPSSVQAQAIVEWIRLEPATFTAGAWQTGLARVELGPLWLQGSYDLFARNRYWSRQSFTKTLFTTRAPFFILEQFCNNAAPNGNGCAIQINGSMSPNVFRSTGTTAVPVWDFPKTTLAEGGILNEIEIDSGPSQNGPGGGGSSPGNFVGTFPTALYVPQNYITSPTQRTNTREAFTLYGDSIPLGIGVINPEFSGISQNLRQLLPYDFISECIGGRSLIADIASNGTIAKLALVLTRNRPKYLWIEVGTNDYGGAAAGTGPVATWQADLQALLIACAALVPDMWILVQSITSRTFEGANAFGDTAPNYRTAASNAVTGSGLAKIQFVDASAWIIPATQTIDGLHMNNFGQAIYVQKVLTTLRTANFT